jgi:hypothetical protein
MVIVCNDGFAQMQVLMVQDFNLLFGMWNCNNNAYPFNKQL